MSVDAAVLAYVREAMNTDPPPSGKGLLKLMQKESASHPEWGVINNKVVRAAKDVLAKEQAAEEEAVAAKVAAEKAEEETRIAAEKAAEAALPLCETCMKKMRVASKIVVCHGCDEMKAATPADQAEADSTAVWPKGRGLHLGNERCHGGFFCRGWPVELHVHCYGIGMSRATRAPRSFRCPGNHGRNAGCHDAIVSAAAMNLELSSLPSMAKASTRFHFTFAAASMRRTNVVFNSFESRKILQQ
eukprot:gene4457-21691_t